MTKLNILMEENSFEVDEEKKTKAIKYLRSLVEEEKLLKVRKDDNFLLRYLRSCEFDAETAMQKMITYYSLKRQNPEWYITEEPMSLFKSELGSQLFYVLEDRDRFGKRIYINKLDHRSSRCLSCNGTMNVSSGEASGMIDTTRTTMPRQSQLQDFFLESILDEEDTQKNGLLIIVDLKNFSWTLLKWLTPANVCIAVKKIESLPLKKIEFHVVNTSALLNAAIKLIWPFLSARTKENIHFHYEDWPSLHKNIDPQCLPRQYGGTKLVSIDSLLKIIPKGEESLTENLRLGYTRGPHF